MLLIHIEFTIIVNNRLYSKNIIIFIIIVIRVWLLFLVKFLPYIKVSIIIIAKLLLLLLLLLKYIILIIWIILLKFPLRIFLLAVNCLDAISCENISIGVLEKSGFKKLCFLLRYFYRDFSYNTIISFNVVKVHFFLLPYKGLLLVF